MSKTIKSVCVYGVGGVGGYFGGKYHERSCFSGENKEVRF